MENKRHLIQDIYSPQPINKPTPPARHNPNPRPPQFKQQFQQTKAPSKRKKRGKLIFGVLTILFLVGVGLFLLKPASPPPVNKEAASTSKVQAAAVEEINPIDYTALESQINSIIAKYPALQISVAYTDIKSTTTIKSGVAAPYIAASTAKLLTAVLFLREVQNGKHTLDTKVAGLSAKEQLRKMIEDSDNPSWDAFNKLLTKASLNQFASDTGLVNYKYETNTSTPSDIALLLEKLYKNQLLNPENTQLLLSYMQHASENQYIPAALPPEVKVFHKAGYLNDRAHDAAIVDDGKNPFVLVIFTKSNGAYDFEQGKKIMHEITNVIRTAYSN